MSRSASPAGTEGGGPAPGAKALGEPSAAQLPDGRTLSYAEYGTADGVPALFFHGTPGSRFEAAIFHQAAVRQGVRLIAPERPGLGGSTWQAGRTLLGWADDVAAFADHLGLDRFPVAGWSGGGAHALACGRALPDRVTTAVSLCGVGPAGGPPLSAGMRAFNKLAVALVPRPKALTRLLAAVGALGTLDRRPLPPLAELLAEPLDRKRLFTLMRHDTTAAFRQGSWPGAWDFVLNMTPWGFSPADITVPVHVWYGDEDVHVGEPLSRYLCSLMPTAVVHRVPDGDHYLVLDEADAIMQVLRDAA